MTFLSVLLTGKTNGLSKKHKRLISSFGQDICRAVTNAEWKLPKHILLCMTLRHLFRSKELITLLNRFGHCENHSFSLELETMIANAVNASSSLITNQIIRNPIGPTVFHSQFDNYDQLINDLSGKGSVHTAHGIMMQEVGDDEVSPVMESAGKPREKFRSMVHEDNEVLEDCYVTHRNSPQLNIQRKSVPGSQDASSSAISKDGIWIFLRNIHSHNPSIPNWGGFVSETGIKPSKITTIDYYPVVFHPITEFSIVQRCL